MAKDFGKMNMNKGKIEAIAKKSNEQANLITIKYIEDENLVDYPQNNEDVEYTEDIELSIKEQGFTDPIEITDFGMENGKYMILSGHRRRMAGRKCELKSFPCIIRHFNNENEVMNYVLMANAQRDSAKDPLLFAKRYKMHEEYLKGVNFKGSIREKVAERLGLKVAQADRYNQLNKVILPFWDMIRSEVIGLSSVTDSGLYTHSVEEQQEMLIIFNEANEQGVRLNREVCKSIVVAYRNGKRSWEEISKTENPNPTPTNPIMNLPQYDTSSNDNDTSSDDDVNPLERNNETNYDTSHRENLPSGVDPYADERLNDDDMDVINNASNKQEEEKQKEKDDRPKDIQLGDKVLKTLANLEALLEEIYRFEDIEQSKSAIRTFGTISELLIDNMETVLGDNDYDNALEQVCIGSLTSIEQNIIRIKKSLER